MSGKQWSRRRALRAGATLGSTALLGSVAGCQDGPSDGDGEGTETNDGPPSGTLATVPDFAEFVASVDVGTVLDREGVQTTTEDLLAVLPAGEDTPETFSGLLDRAESETGLDPRAVGEVVTFGATAESQFGAVLRTEWSEDDVVGAAGDADADFEEATYEGITVYESDAGERPVGFALLGDGTVAAGDTETVEAVVDVARGDADPVAGTVRSEYDVASDGVVRLGFEAPSGGTGGSGLDGDIVNDTASGHGSLTFDDDATATFEVTAESTDSAEAIASTLEGRLASLRRSVQRSDGGGTMGDLTNRIVTVVENTSVTRDGRAVTVTTSSSVEAVTTVVGAVVGSVVLGVGNRQEPRAPAISFGAEYDASAGTVTLTHEGGDTVPRSELYVRGSGFRSFSGADMTGPGQWRGTTSGGTDDTAVAAGDRVTVGVQSDYEIRVVWRAADGSQSATLAAFEGPDA